MDWLTKLENYAFKVRYRFYTPDEGGRKTGPPFQGYKPNFLYSGDDPRKDGVYMIWPMFEDSDGNIIYDDKIPYRIRELQE